MIDELENYEKERFGVPIIIDPDSKGSVSM